MTFLSAPLSVATLALGTGANRLKSDMGTLSRTLASGQPADIARHLRTEVAAFSRLTAATRSAQAGADLGTSVSQRLDLQALVVDDLRQRLTDLRGQAQIVTQSNTSADLMRLQETFADRFREMVSQLNQTGPAGPLFTGATGALPLLSAQGMISALGAGLDLTAPADTIVQQVRDWFSPGGGFDTIAYLGGSGVTTLVPVGDDYIQFPAPTADQAAFRDLMATFVIGGLGRLAPGLPPDMAQAMTYQASGDLTARLDSLNGLRAGIAVQQENVAQATLRARAQAEFLDLQKAQLIEIDPFKTAAALQENIQQTELVFALTARLSRLSLAEYLR